MTPKKRLDTTPHLEAIRWWTNLGTGLPSDIWDKVCDLRYGELWMGGVRSLKEGLQDALRSCGDI